MILKLLLVIGVIAVVYFLFIKKKPSVKSSNENSNTPKDEIQSNDMIECSVCGVYSDITDTILSNSKYYCSNECLEKD